MTVKIHALPLSQTAIGPSILAQHAECGDMVMCQLFQGAHKTEEFTKLNPYQLVPTLEDGDFSLGEVLGVPPGDLPRSLPLPLPSDLLRAFPLRGPFLA